MKKNQEENGRISDQIELFLGNTHRCANCGQLIDLTMVLVDLVKEVFKEAPKECPGCGSSDLVELEGLDKCRQS